MSEKRCIKCHLTKPLSDFYVHVAMRDGHLNKCKSCCLINAKLERVLFRERVQLRERKRDQKPARKEKKRLYHQGFIQRNPDYYIEAQKRRRALFPEKYKANCAVNNALRDGRLTKLPCQVCGEGKVDAHHENYLKPLEVIWLCRVHHAAVHHPDPFAKQKEEAQQ